MSAYSFLLPSAELGSRRYTRRFRAVEDDGLHQRYPKLSRRGRSLPVSVLTIVGAGALAISAAVLVSSVSFNFSNLDATSELGQLYGQPSCPSGQSMYDSPINNFAWCCAHYAATCCDLHGDACVRLFKFTVVGRANSSAAGSTHTHHSHEESHCDRLLSLLSCAQCSPFAGHFIESPALLRQRPRVLVCDSFCHSLYEACIPAARLDLPADGGDDQRHVDFCEQQLGLRVGGRLLAGSGATESGSRGDSTQAETCFAAGHVSAAPLHLLSLGLPVLLASFLGILHR